MIILEPIEMGWICDDGDDPHDLCLHGGITFLVDGISQIVDEGATLSASALYLLRTLEKDHSKENPLFEQLFPCCGNGIYDVGEDDVVIIGCASGADCYVMHREGRVILGDVVKYSVTEDMWRLAVLGFSENVFSFYESCMPKIIPDEEDKKGFLCFLAEWERRWSKYETSKETSELLKNRFASFRQALKT